MQRDEIISLARTLELVLNRDIVKNLPVEQSVLGTENLDVSKLGDFLKIGAENKIIHVKPWLKTRAYESVVAQVGLREYLRSLVSYSGPDPDKNVPVNPLFSSIHILTATNIFTSELLNLLMSWKKIPMTHLQYETAKSVIKPNKLFEVTFSSSFFESHQIEDIRNELLRYSLDILSKFEYENFAYQQQLKKIEYELPTAIPTDLQFLSNMPEVRSETLFSLSVRYQGLHLAFMDGYLLWKFQKAPTIFIKQNKSYYSPKMSEHGESTTKQSAWKQVVIMTQALRKIQKLLSAPTSDPESTSRKGIV
jgi:hypothetical protein